MNDGNIGKAERNAHHDQPHRHASRHTAGHITGQDDPIRYGGNQQFLDMPLKLAAVKRCHHVGISVGDHRHEYQARHDELGIPHASDRPDPIPDQLSKDDAIQRRGGGCGQQRLNPDPGKTPDLLGQQGGQGHSIAPAVRHGGSFHDAFSD